MVVRVPVKTMLLPDNAPETAFAPSGRVSDRRSSRAARFRGSSKKATSSVAMEGPIPWIEPRSSRASEPITRASTIASRHAVAEP